MTNHSRKFRISGLLTGFSVAIMLCVPQDGRGAEPATREEKAIAPPAAEEKAATPAAVEEKAHRAAPAAVKEPASALEASSPETGPGRISSEIPASPNIKSEKDQSVSAQLREYELKLGLARSERRAHDLVKAENDFLVVVNGNAPEEMKKAALSELGGTCEEAKEYAKAQKVYARWIRQYPEDPGLLEILLRQGLLYRTMGANGMAMAKFYSVMSTALNLKLDRLSYYKQLVLRAQTEVAETFYLQGKYAEAADKLKLLLKLDSPDLNRGIVSFKYIRCLYKLESYPEVVAKAQTFLDDFPDVAEQPEVRFLLASSLKKLGRTSESLEQVTLLLRSQQKTADLNPENWRYWQQRTGNEIANMLFQEGDFLNSLLIYTRLAELDSSPKWQLPVLYQVGLVYEQLRQPEKANEVYARILSHEKDPGIEALDTVKTVIDMSRFRQNRLNWQVKAEKVEKDLGAAAPEPAPSSNP